MYAGEQLKYGQIRGGEQSTPVVIKAAEVIKAKSGRFVARDSGGTATVVVAADGTAEIIGFLQSEEILVAAGETRDCVIDLTAIFRIPINSGTYVATMKGKTCDLSVASSIQGAQLDASSKDTVVIVDGDEVNNKWVDVRINPNKQTVGVV